MRLLRNILLSALLLFGSVGYSQNKLIKVGNSLIKVGNNLLYTPFLPSDITGLDLWMDSDFGITKDGSNNVSQWDDRTGSHSLIQGTGAAQPDFNANQINGHSTIDFNGTSDFLKEMVADYLIGSNTGTIFIVGISNNTNKDENIFSSSNEGGSNDFVIIDKSPTSLGNNSIKININNGGVTNGVYGDTNLVDNSPHILTYESNGSSYGLRIDGTNQTVNEAVGGNDNGTWFGDVSNRDNIVFGALVRSSTANFNSRFAEALIYDTEISTGDRGLVEAYLSTKYNISIP